MHQGHRPTITTMVFSMSNARAELVLPRFSYTGPSSCWAIMIPMVWLQNTAIMPMEDNSKTPQQDSFSARRDSFS